MKTRDFLPVLLCLQSIHFCEFGVVKQVSQDNSMTIAILVQLRERVVNGNKTECGEVKERPGIMLIEAISYSMEQLNKYAKAKANITFGYKIYDTCGDPNELSLDLIGILLGYPVAIGPPTPIEASLIRSMFYILNIPLVSYKANSIQFETVGSRPDIFFKTVPSEVIEIRSIVAVVLHFKWKYVSFVSSHSYIGQAMLTELRRGLSDIGACISSESSLAKRPSKSDYQAFVQGLLLKEQAKIIIMLTTWEDSLSIITLLRDSNIKRGRFTIIGGSEWENYRFEDRSIFHIVEGSLVVLNHHASIIGFEDYFLRLNPTSESAKTYTEFNTTWEKIFNCTLSSSQSTVRHCSGMESLSVNRGYYPMIPLNPITAALSMVVQAWITSVLLLCPDANQRDLCLTSNTAYSWSTELSRNSMRTGHFVDILTNRSNSVNKAGQIDNIGFDIINIQNNSGELTYRKIGEWMFSGELVMSDADITWGNRSVPTSVCSLPCRVGEIKVLSQALGNGRCCWQCFACQMNDLILNDTCYPCGKNYRPNKDRTQCLELTCKRLDFNRYEGIIFCCLSCIGVMATLGVLAAFIKHRNSAVLKPSGRELCCFILLGLLLLFCAPVVLFAKPSRFTCGVERINVSLSLTICYAALFMKVYRIYRVFRHTKSLTKLQFVSPTSQIIICILIVCVQFVLCGVWILADPPVVHQDFPLDKSYYMEFCYVRSYTMAINLAICLCLMISCTWLAFKTRNFPKNYNEAKSIGVTMYTSCLLWSVFMPTYFNARNHDDFRQTIILALFCILIGFVTLVGLFGSRLSLVYFPHHVGDHYSSSEEQIKRLKISTRGNDFSRESTVCHEETYGSVCKRDMATCTSCD